MGLFDILGSKKANERELKERIGHPIHRTPREMDPLMEQIRREMTRDLAKARKRSK